MNVYVNAIWFALANHEKNKEIIFVLQYIKCMRIIEDYNTYKAWETARKRKEQKNETRKKILKKTKKNASKYSRRDLY